MRFQHSSFHLNAAIPPPLTLTLLLTIFPTLFGLSISKLDQCHEALCVFQDHLYESIFCTSYGGVVATELLRVVFAKEQS